MIFVIITHVPHSIENKAIYAYAPYVREMNSWIEGIEKLIIVAPLSNSSKTAIDINYEHENIEFVPIEGFDVLSLKGIVLSVYKIPRISWRIFFTMQKADHIHLRCPGNIGLLGCFIQIAFPDKQKTAKYAGNWDPKAKQPWTYQLQKWMLSSSFLTRNMQVLVYGEWEGMTKNIKPFFTATYKEEDKAPIIRNDLKNQISFIFVGTLVKGKNPLYAIQLVENLSKKGFDVMLHLFGEGVMRTRLEQYIIENQLDSVIRLEGNQPKAIVQKAFQESHFVLLPSESEGWPKAIAEGMFWGCVPVATSVSCVPFMLDYGNRGVLLEMVSEKDTQQLVDIMKNQEVYDDAQTKAVAWSRRYTIDVFEKEVERLLNNTDLK
jgi:glycosyltransferase involved in cell wall biosynthesis